LLEQVQLGALGREYPGIAAQCGLSPTAAPVATTSIGPVAAQARPIVVPAQTDSTNSGRWWPWAALALIVLAVAGAAIWDTRRRKRMWEQRRARRRRPVPDDRTSPPRPSRAWRRSMHQPAQDDEELLRKLLEG
jgi:hypothetical protein